MPGEASIIRLGRCLVILQYLTVLVVCMQPSTGPDEHPEKPTAGPTRGSFVSVQVNVDERRRDVVDDAANTPSIAVDPTDPKKLVIAWRQFDNIRSNFAEVGAAYSHDGGQTWTVLPSPRPGEYAFDGTAQCDRSGVFYVSSTGASGLALSRSLDGGVTWSTHSWPLVIGGAALDTAVDLSAVPGKGNIYGAWADRFVRFTEWDETPPAVVSVPRERDGPAVAVGVNGAVYAAAMDGGEVTLARSADAKNPKAEPTFRMFSAVNLGGIPMGDVGPNPGGTLGRLQLACDHSKGGTRGNLYLLRSVDPPGSDPLDVMFTSSADAGKTWSKPVRINDDAGNNMAWQWFATMSVAPNGRIDVIWNDTRGNPTAVVSELYYASSKDGGRTWSKNVPVSPPFDPYIGWPNQNKLGDACGLVSDNEGASIAYAATFNRGQDVYFLRVPHKP